MLAKPWLPTESGTYGLVGFATTDSLAPAVEASVPQPVPRCGETPHFSSRMTTRRLSVLLPALLSFSAGLCAQEQDLTDLDLATLMGMDVTLTSATKRETAAADAPAAVYVITREDIRRSGATTLPEVLRLAPGIQVARLNARAWAVTARGFNSRFAAKLLVMVDGRNIYTPIFSGVLWEEQAMPLEDIERVEVVRGPGGALWGINAVNGVVNIITRTASQSQGLQARAGAGSADQQAAALSFGASNEVLGAYKLSLSHAEQQSFPVLGAVQSTHAGVRIDRELGAGAFTVQAGYTEGDLGRRPPPPAGSLATSADTANLSASWTTPLDLGRLEISGYYTDIERGVPNRWGESSAGLDVQFSAERLGRHLVTGGLSYRFAKDELGETSAILRLTDAQVSQNQWGIYAQDEVHFFADALRITLGGKLEDLEFTGMAFQPTFRALWEVNDTHTLWGAASRAVRTPSRIELHSRMTFLDRTPDGPVVVRVNGQSGLHAEDLHAYELGWRWRPRASVSLDAALYRHDYDNLIGSDPQPPVLEMFPVPTLYVNADFANLRSARVDGAEAVLEWAPLDWMRLEAQGNWMNTRVSGYITAPVDPEESYSVRAQFDLPRNLELDLGWRSVDELAGEGPLIGGYDSFNLRAGWKPIKQLELSLSIDNVLDNRHIEFLDDLSFSPGVTVGRTYFARVNWSPAR